MVSIYILGSFVIFMLLKMPISLSMAISSLIGLLIAGVPLTTIPQWMAHGVHSYPLMAIPFFIFAGGLLNAAGLTNRIFNFANVFVSRLPGGLAQVAVISAMIFSGISGSMVADEAALGPIEMKAMTEKGYEKNFSAAVIVSSCFLGPHHSPQHHFHHLCTVREDLHRQDVYRRDCSRTHYRRFYDGLDLLCCSHWKREMSSLLKN